MARNRADSDKVYESYESNKEGHRIIMHKIGVSNKLIEKKIKLLPLANKYKLKVTKLNKRRDKINKSTDWGDDLQDGNDGAMLTPEQNKWVTDMDKIEKLIDKATEQVELVDSKIEGIDTTVSKLDKEIKKLKDLRKNEVTKMGAYIKRIEDRNKVIKGLRDE